MRWWAVVAALPVLERVPRLEEDVNTAAVRTPARAAHVGVASDGTIDTGAVASLVEAGSLRVAEQAGGAICNHVTLEGKPCVFPFKYKRTMYNKCTSQDSRGQGPWCFTSETCAKDDCELKKEFWGRCDCKGTTHEVNTIEWTYNSEGQDLTYPNPDRQPQQQHIFGQSQWGGVSDQCKMPGIQSPVDILSSIVKVDNEEVKLHGEPCDKMELLMNGVGVFVSYNACEQKPKLTYKGRTYHMDRILFKTPSEHELDGHYFPMEAQLVHTEIGEDGIQKGRIVVSVFNEVQLGNTKDNPFLNTFWERMTHLVPAIEVGDQVKLMTEPFDKKLENFEYTTDPACPGCSPFDDQFKGATCKVVVKPEEGKGEYEVECDREEGAPVRLKMPHGACNGNCNEHYQTFTWESAAEAAGGSPTTLYEEYLPGDPKLPLHERGGFFFYEGTGTRPPCNATGWIILRQPVAVSKAQVDHLRTYFQENGGGKAPLNAIGTLLMQPTGNGAAMAYTFDVTKGKTNRQIQLLNEEGSSKQRVITYNGPSLAKGKAAFAASVFMFAYLV